MYFSALKNAVQNVEEKRFYDVALMYLEQRGYKELSIIDGPRDGGCDVICSRKDLRIQLSVRKDWRVKINEEAEKALDLGKKHLIFVTNKQIRPVEEQEFLDGDYRYKGIVDVNFSDLRKISTSLARPGVIQRAYDMLGMAVPSRINAQPKDIAISTVLLFSSEAKDLRDKVIEANVLAFLFKVPGSSQPQIATKVSEVIPGGNIDREVKSSISRLRISGRLRSQDGQFSLSQGEYDNMFAAETEFLAAREGDINDLVTCTGLGREDASKLLGIAVELLIRGRELEGDGPLEVSLRKFISDHGLSRQRDSVFRALSATRTARVRQYGATLDRMFSTNSFDIYRALGCHTDLSMVLDASVAMPVMFGLAFGEANSRYGLAAMALQRGCSAHGIKLGVPRVYLNEMAAHGRAALERLDSYSSLSQEAREPLVASDNAYISHFTHIAETLKESGDDISLSKFLGYFGVSSGKSVNSIENRIQTILESHGIRIIECGAPDEHIRLAVQDKKKYGNSLLIDHDSIVLTFLKSAQDKGFIFATWDRVMIDLVEGLARVYADTPARVIDFLSMASGSEYESDQSYDLLSTLVYVEERAIAPLAEMIDKIRTADRAYKLDEFIRVSREVRGSAWELTPDDVARFIDHDELGAHLTSESAEKNLESPLNSSTDTPS